MPGLSGLAPRERPGSEWIVQLGVWPIGRSMRPRRIARDKQLISLDLVGDPNPALG
jgi:hypothetical protein